MNNTYTPPPKFQEANHHFIPQFWIRYFADSGGRLWKRQDGRVTQTATARIMAEDWLYTEFDQHWRPGDGVEDRLSAYESRGSALFRDLDAATGLPTDEQWNRLFCWLAFTVCRHPQVMRRGHRRVKEMAWALADASQHADEAAFHSEIQSRFGVLLPDGQRVALIAKCDEDLLLEAEEIEGLSPQDPRLQMLIALSGTGEVAMCLARMNWILFEPPQGSSFVLGDCPIPVENYLRASRPHSRRGWLSWRFQAMEAASAAACVLRPTTRQSASSTRTKSPGQWLLS